MNYRIVNSVKINPKEYNRINETNSTTKEETGEKDVKKDVKKDKYKENLKSLSNIIDIDIGDIDYQHDIIQEKNYKKNSKKKVKEPQETFRLNKNSDTKLTRKEHDILLNSQGKGMFYYIYMLPIVRSNLYLFTL